MDMDVEREWIMIKDRCIGLSRVREHSLPGLLGPRMAEAVRPEALSRQSAHGTLHEFIAALLDCVWLKE